MAGGKKPIKMVVRVDGQETVVGSCHPGQARILRKHGMAEWDVGKLVLKAPSPPPPPKPKSSWTPHLGTMESPPLFGLSHRISAFQVLSDDEAERSRASEDLSAELGEAHATETLCDSIEEWLGELKARKEANHFLWTADDPFGFRIGFLDNDEGKIFYLRLATIKRTPAEAWEGLGVTRDQLSSAEGREALLAPLNPPGEDPVEIPEGVTLESLWIEQHLTDREKAAREREARQEEIIRIFGGGTMNLDIGPPEILSETTKGDMFEGLGFALGTGGSVEEVIATWRKQKDDALTKKIMDAEDQALLARLLPPEEKPLDDGEDRS